MNKETPGERMARQKFASEKAVDFQKEKNQDKIKNIPEPPVKHEEIPAKQTKKTLLLVEDNPISQSLELRILQEVGYNVEAVSSGREALDALKTRKFDLVLMDVEMDEMDGIEATKKIRSLSGEVAKIPIIAVTAHSSMKDREMCLNSGMDDYIAKPINIHFLKITIDLWLNSER